MPHCRKFSLNHTLQYMAIIWLSCFKGLLLADHWSHKTQILRPGVFWWSFRVLLEMIYHRLITTCSVLGMFTFVTYLYMMFLLLAGLHSQSDQHQLCQVRPWIDTKCYSYAYWFYSAKYNKSSAIHICSIGCCGNQWSIACWRRWSAADTEGCKLVWLWNSGRISVNWCTITVITCFPGLKLLR